LLRHVVVGVWHAVSKISKTRGCREIDGMIAKLLTPSGQ
jgi:hypothetical protein